MRIVTVTDAWHPQVNGVVRTIEATNRELDRAGHATEVVTPQDFASVPCPGYAEIRLSLLPYRGVRHKLDRILASHTDVAIHIATEGPLGHAARSYCLARSLPFTTAYHTRFPQYLKAMFGVPERWTYAFLRYFHGPAAKVMAPTHTVARELRDHGLANVALWTRGVDVDVFRPYDSQPQDMKRPVFLYVGRVSVEKNIQAFLALDLPGTKVVAGIGPELEALRKRFPEVRFVGVLDPENLARLYSAADVFVFPSRTDTFGLVMLEALACGTPVAAFPVQGPIDVVGGSGVAVLDEDLRKAALHALRIDRTRGGAHAEQYSWRGHRPVSNTAAGVTLECPAGSNCTG
jgi:glycosyltransferase involved in cell wall biosynthesis